MAHAKVIINTIGLQIANERRRDCLLRALLLEPQTFNHITVTINCGVNPTLRQTIFNTGNDKKFNIERDNFFGCTDNVTDSGENISLSSSININVEDLENYEL